MSKQIPNNKNKKDNVNDFTYGRGVRTKPGEKLMTSKRLENK